MSTPRVPGSQVLCAHLARLGARCVFGVPGTQNVEVFEALRRSTIRTIGATHELAAAFMANGWARATGRPGVVVTIPGPGFAMTLPALAEARLDSTPLLVITGNPVAPGGRRFQLQEIDQRALSAPVAKQFFAVEKAIEIGRTIQEAHEVALRGEPGPVVVQVARAALAELEVAPPERAAAPLLTPIPGDFGKFEEAFAALVAARRIALLVGQGACGVAGGVQQMAEWLQSPVVTTTSGRGILPEDHPLAFPLDLVGDRFDDLNELLGSCDRILAIGCKLGHNGTGGYRLQLAPEKLLHVDAADHVLEANYPASLAIRGDAVEFVRFCLRRRDDAPERALAWNLGELQRWQDRLRSTSGSPDALEPRFPDFSPPTAASFFGALRRALPKEGVLVTDSGLHQLLARKHFTVLGARTFLVPTDFQSMGFGIPAAAGAKLAQPERPVVALIGDGGFAMTGLELLALVRERVPITVVVLNDGQLGLIRLKQLAEYGIPFATDLHNPDFEKLAESIGVSYDRIDGDGEATLRRAIGSGKPGIVEVRVSDSLDMHKIRAKGLARDTAERVLGPQGLEWLRDRARRFGIG